LASIVRQGPDEVHVAINGPRNARLEEVCARFAPLVRWGWSPVADKREAEASGLAATRGEIVIFVDSDTEWTEAGEGTLVELLKPFADARVGGVTTYQEVRNAEASIYARFAAWREAVRWLFAPLAQSVLGQVGVLPGRTIALRREIVEANVGEFLAAPVKISDDRELTMLAMRAGFRTVYQQTSVVTTVGPVTLARLLRQQYRWAKGSQYNTVRWFPMMLRRAPFACYCFAADLITPFLLMGVFCESLRRWTDGPWKGMGELAVLLVLTVLGWYLSVALRALPQLLKDWREWLRLPVYLILAFVVILPTSIAGLVTAGWVRGSGWGTRTDALPEQRGIARLGFRLRFGPTLLAALLLVASVALSALFRASSG
jgi:hyaluronan synthase